MPGRSFLADAAVHLVYEKSWLAPTWKCANGSECSRCLAALSKCLWQKCATETFAQSRGNVHQGVDVIRPLTPEKSATAATPQRLNGQLRALRFADADVAAIPVGGGACMGLSRWPAELISPPHAPPRTRAAGGTAWHKSLQTCHRQTTDGCTKKDRQQSQVHPLTACPRIRSRN